MHRFHLPPEACTETRLRLEGAEARHAIRVLRLRPGEQVAVLDGRGGEYACTVAAVDSRRLTLEVHSRRLHRRPACRVGLFQAVAKGRSMDLILQKAVELGAALIQPVLTARSVPNYDAKEAAARQARWQAIAIEAMKQCGNPWLPEVRPPQPFTACLPTPSEGAPVVVADLAADALPFRAWFLRQREARAWPPTEIALWIGPEGDFTPEEREQLFAAGATPVSFGPRILRCETAALYGLAVLQHELQEI
ncbi:MAG: 16S rRNA (uracil(1498)-N(3))-methyltransferase [Verrucomicrobia bacterium]|nr:MAG: 16S rRNA (uracil(1498)-N(3))-methyltransferase [Verrucomicrobiota bacterium]